MTVRLLHGCEPEKLDTNRLKIFAGSISDWGGNSEYNFLADTIIDLRNNGLNGLDSGAVADGDELYIYLISNQTTTGFIASRSPFAGGVTYPAGFAFKRKLPIGFIYKNAWDGIPNHHLSHWPLPEVRYTDAEYSGLWMPLFASSSAAWVDVDLSPWLPDNARLAHIMVEVRYNGGSAGSGYIRTYGQQATGLLIGSATSGSPYTGQTALNIRTSSTRKIQYKTTGSVQMYMQVLGYSMTERP